MTEGFRGRRPVCGIEREERREQGRTGRGEEREVRSQRWRLMSRWLRREAEGFGVGEAPESGPGLRGGNAEEGEYLWMVEKRGERRISFQGEGKGGGGRRAALDGEVEKGKGGGGFCWGFFLLWRSGRLRSCPGAAAHSSAVRQQCIRCSTCPLRGRTSRRPAAARARGTTASRPAASGSAEGGRQSSAPCRNRPL